MPPFFGMSFLMITLPFMLKKRLYPKPKLMQAAKVAEDGTLALEVEEAEVEVVEFMWVGAMIIILVEEGAVEILHMTTIHR